MGADDFTDSSHRAHQGFMKSVHFADMRRWRPFHLFSLFVLIVIVGADLGLLGLVVQLIHRVPAFDKVAHAVLIGTLAWLLNQGLRWRQVNIRQRRWLLGSLIVGVAFTLEECSQAWIPGRSFDLGDLAANWTGVWLAGLLRRRWPDRPDEQPSAISHPPSTLSLISSARPPGHNSQRTLSLIHI